MTPREELLKQIQAHNFAAVDLALFLDTHPEDADALAAYRRCLDIKQQLCERFATCYGPLTQALAGTEDRWDWVDQPWPWQCQAGGKR